MINTTIPVSLFVGNITAFPDSGRPTGIFKTPCSEALELGPEGLFGDHQADRRVHGGPEKAVHLYPREHYAALAKRFPEAAPLLVPGSIGENLSATGLGENDIHLGDIFSLGDALLQLSQPRNPCWKIDARYDCDGMAAYIAETGLTGWYWRVLQPGRVVPGDGLQLVSRHSGTPTLGAAMATWRLHRPARSDLEAIATAPGIAADWQRKILARLDWLRNQAGGA